MTWSNHYNIITKSAKRLCGWILSSFYSRSQDVMIVLFNSLVRSKLEYCCELWSPYLIRDIVLLEQIQRSFTSRICGQQDYNYWERLSNLKIYSLQRRRDRSCILHMWKIKNNVFPNSACFSFRLNNRKNSMLAILKPMPRIRGKLLTIYEQSFLVNSCKLWNILPSELTHITSLNIFKNKLDKFLKDIPDEPPLPGYPSVNSNSLTEQCLRY